MQLGIDVAAGPVLLELPGELGETMVQRQHHERFRDATGTRISFYKEHIRQWVQPEDIVARTYRAFLKCINLKGVIIMMSLKSRWELARLRTSSHLLRVEVDRHQR
jgi:hypothetical protein